MIISRPLFLACALVLTAAPVAAQDTALGNRVVGDTFASQRAAHQQQLDAQTGAWDARHADQSGERAALRTGIADGQAAHQDTIHANTQRWTDGWHAGSAARAAAATARDEAARAHQDYIASRPAAWWNIPGQFNE